MGIEVTERALIVHRLEDGLAVVRQNVNSGERPYLHPVLAPDGVGIVTQDRPDHHPWQHGLYVGLNAVNGDDFWTEGLIPEHSPRFGSFEIVSSEIIDDGDCGEDPAWAVRTRYVGHDGDPVLLETQAWRMRDDGVTIALDLDWTLEALRDVVFGEYPYGGPMIRMPYDPGAGALVLTSEGATTPAAAEGRRARWVAVGMPIPGREALLEPVVTVTAMDHPGNPEHPVPWRVDDGFGVIPSRCIAGEWRLAAGESTTASHRFLVTLGPPDSHVAEASYRSFSGREPS